MKVEDIYIGTIDTHSQEEGNNKGVVRRLITDPNVMYRKKHLHMLK